MKQMTSWGRLQTPWHHVYPLTDRFTVGACLKTTKPGLAYGMGRSYGDVCLNPEGNLWHTTGLNKFMQFDADSGLFSCEAGVLLRDIQRLMLPRGWTLPVTAGTQMITVGGAIANDIHGKNQHKRGTFGEHVKRLRLVRTSGKMADCGPENHAEWFSATIGGLVLTGVITDVTLQLQAVGSEWLHVEIIPYQQLTEFFQLAKASQADWEYTTSWVDCTAGAQGRGIFMRASPASSLETVPDRLPKRALSVPFTPPLSCVNSLSLRAFNEVYYRLHQFKAGQHVMHREDFLYPLDHVQDWNRLYGPKGFYQYQSVVPFAGAYDAIAAMLAVIKAAGEGSFMAALQTFAARPAAGLLSFPQEGVSLALDFPERGHKTRKLLTELDAIVQQANGRLYPAKDVRMPRDLFTQGYPELSRFLPYRDPGISSGLSRRLMGS